MHIDVVSSTVFTGMVHASGTPSARAVARLRQRRRQPPLILGKEIKNSRMQENMVAVRILRIDQQISPPPFLRSGYGPASATSAGAPGCMHAGS